MLNKQKAPLRRRDMKPWLISKRWCVVSDGKSGPSLAMIRDLGLLKLVNKIKETVTRDTQGRETRTLMMGWYNDRAGTIAVKLLSQNYSMKQLTDWSRIPER